MILRLFDASYVRAVGAPPFFFDERTPTPPWVVSLEGENFPQSRESPIRNGRRILGSFSRGRGINNVDKLLRVCAGKANTNIGAGVNFEKRPPQPRRASDHGGQGAGGVLAVATGWAPPPYPSRPRGPGRGAGPPPPRRRAQRGPQARGREEGGSEWWRGTESNCRHYDFQSYALPTELPRHGREISRSEGSDHSMRRGRAF